jgi:hypothetical protein
MKGLAARAAEAINQAILDISLEPLLFQFSRCLRNLIELTAFQQIGSQLRLSG